MKTALCWYLLLLLFLVSCEKQDADPCRGPCPENLTPVSEKISRHCKGFFEYLPEGYHEDSVHILYPVLLFFHGAGEVGDGNDELYLLFEHGPLKHVEQGTFPSFFSVNGKEEHLILIAPQFTKSGVFSEETGQIIDYILDHYHADPDRIYLTGLSIGGANCWQYAGYSTVAAQRIAAMAPAAANIDEDEKDLQVTPERAQRIVNANIPVWSFHNKGDPLADLTWVVNAHTLIADADPPPRLTVFDDDTHGGWDKAYDPVFREEGMNVYEWLLQFER
jgi:predicted peptidase